MGTSKTGIGVVQPKTCFAGKNIVHRSIHFLPHSSIFKVRCTWKPSPQTTAAAWEWAPLPSSHYLRSVMMAGLGFRFSKSELQAHLGSLESLFCWKFQKHTCIQFSCRQNKSCAGREPVEEVAGKPLSSFLLSHGWEYKLWIFLVIFCSKPLGVDVLFLEFSSLSRFYLAFICSHNPNTRGAKEV